MRSRQMPPWRRIAIVTVMLLVGAALPVRAQDDAGHKDADEARPTAPAPNHTVPDEPPPLNLGGPPKQSPSDQATGRWHSYAEAVVNALQPALYANSKTRLAQPDVEFEMWIDPKGHVTRVQLVAPTGDAKLDAAFREVLSRLTLPEPAPDMPMPVKGHISGSGRSDG